MNPARLFCWQQRSNSQWEKCYKINQQKKSLPLVEESKKGVEGGLYGGRGRAHPSGIKS